MLDTDGTPLYIDHGASLGTIYLRFKKKKRKRKKEKKKEGRICKTVFFFVVER